MSEIKLRCAEKSDAADLAMLDNLAGHGISLWFWKRETPSGLIEDALALGRKRLANPDVIYGFKNATVAVIDEMVGGSVSAYQMPPSQEDEEQIKRDAPVFAPVFDLFEQCVGDWFIDSLAVFPEFRGKGIGATLFDAALKDGQTHNMKTASLVVEASNETALGLYQSRGFTTIDARPFIEFRGPSETKEWLLLSKEIS